MINHFFILFISIVMLAACSNISSSNSAEIETNKALIMVVSNASYDQINKKAFITLNQAFQKSQIIKSYKGERITVAYKNEYLNENQCPNINTHLKNVQRDIDFVNNNVTITVSNVGQNLANSIDNAKCFSIDARIVKAVSDLYFSTSDYIEL